ncbi:MAG: hypothetical protein K0S23_614 [Fluviicola sp.]|jgi:hypothetical protein|uniref:hypothetical protein n=1 Tax=Fluviicola sp. TaxID=1917219 RepID=UPI002604A7E7|nr:hypothetical protein [Fluviicola sp.]MDF3026307.1 hypothetical protein [Fluviicola sp.]
MKKLIIGSICLFSLLACTKEKFSVNHSFWYNTATADDLAAYGIDELTLYVDEVEIATIDAYAHYTADPGCGVGNFVFTDMMFKRENKTHAYKILDEGDSLIFQGSFQMKQKTGCESTQLVHSF